MSVLGRAVRSSSVVRIGQRVFMGSVVWRGATVIVTSLVRTVPDVSSDSNRRINVLCADSRVLRGLSSSLDAAAASWQRSAVRKKVMSELRASDESARVRTVAIAVVAAVASHTVVVALLGVPVHALGWIARLAMLAAAMILISRPASAAAAWRDWRAR
jgi:hypothetical protein